MELCTVLYGPVWNVWFRAVPYSSVRFHCTCISVLYGLHYPTRLWVRCGGSIRVHSVTLPQARHLSKPETDQSSLTRERRLGPIIHRITWGVLIQWGPGGPPNASNSDQAVTGVRSRPPSHARVRSGRRTSAASEAGATTTAVSTARRAQTFGFGATRIRYR